MRPQAKAALMMPLFMVISAVYGAPGTDKTNNFSRNLVLYNLVMINASCNAFMTGSGANLLAIALLAGAGCTIYYFDWLMAGLPFGHRFWHYRLRSRHEIHFSSLERGYSSET